MAAQTILIIDDEKILVEMITLRLEISGYQVEAAYDGLDGLAKARIIQPDLIILDINMPKMDGYTALKEIRQDDTLKDTPVMMLSASGKLREKFEEVGISDYITKPFDTQDFLSRIERILKQ